MMKNTINSLLFKNGFRVFGKTKMLASQLTILTTLATTGVTATILTNYNLDMSKKAILTEGNAFDFSVDPNINNKLPVKVQELTPIQEQLFTVPFNNHLSSNVTTHDFKTKTFTWNGTILNSKNGSAIWKSVVPNEQQKLVYYFATEPNQNGTNLMRMKNYDDNLFSSLTNIPESLKNEIFKNTSEIFSFSAGSSSDLQGIPEVINNRLDGPQSFNLNNILLDKNNKPIGVPTYGSIQVTGFDLNNDVFIYHNIVNTNNINQNDFNIFRNKQGGYAVPNNFTIHFGDQNNFISDYISQINSHLGLEMKPDTKTLSHNLEILLGVGDSFNQLAANSENIVTQTKWKPLLISLDPKLLKGVDLFCYQMLINGNNQDKIFDYYYNLMTQYEDSLPKKRLHNNDINLESLIKLQSEYPFLKHIQTLIWVPSYLSEKEAKKEVFNATNKWYSLSHQYFSNLLSSDYKCNQWKNEHDIIISNLKKIITDNKLLNSNEIFTKLLNYLNQNQFYTFDKKYLIQLLNNKKSILFKSLTDNWETNLKIWQDFVSTKIYKALQQFMSPSFYYHSWYTIDGLLDTFGFKYRKSKDFSTQINNEGISYTYSLINQDVKVNNVVSNRPINYDFLNPILEIDTNQFLDLINDFSNIRTSIIDTKSYPISQYGYDWFVKKKPYLAMGILANSTVYDGNSDQVSEIIKICSSLANLTEKEIKNNNDILNKWYPNFKRMLDRFMFRGRSIQNDIISLELAYLIGFGDGATIAIQAYVLDKSAFVSLVSEGYLNANQYSNKNLNGKTIYPYYDSFAKARQLPFFNPNAESNQNFDPTSPYWIYNYDTNQYDYCPDFFTWLRIIPNKYKLTINNQNILIAGSAISPEFLYPTQNENNLLINPKQTPILYTNTFGYNYALNTNANVSSVSYYAIKDVNLSHQNNYYKKYLGLFEPLKKLNNIIKKNITNNPNNLVYSVDDPNQPNRLLYTRANFTNIIQHGLLVASILLSLILLILSGIFACTLIRSIVKQNKKTFGIAISNGISKSKLSLSMISFALIPGVISGVLGYLFATLLQPLIMSSISSYWMLPINYNYYLWWAFILIPIVLVGILFLIIHLVVLWTLRKNVTDLLSSSVSFRMNSLIENSKWLTRKMRPTSAFKLTYMLGNVTRFLTLIGVITTFITMTTTYVGTIDTFSIAMNYTNRNKNYAYGVDLISPTIQGGWYYAIPYSQIGTTQQGIVKTVGQKIDNYQYQPIGTINNQIINAKTSFTDSEITLQTWLQHNLSSYQFNTKQNVEINLPILNKFIDDSTLNLTQLCADIQTFNNYNILALTPKTVTINGSSNKQIVTKPQTVYINYIGQSNTYALKDFDQYWTNPYLENLKYTSCYYLNFNIAQQFLGDSQFFKDNLLMQLALDLDFDLGAIRLNPWSISKTLLPKLVVTNSIISNKITVQRMIDFYAYLDQVANGAIKPIDPLLTYENYYGQMKANKPNNLHNFNPLNINGEPFKFNHQNKPIIDPNYCLIITKKEIGADDSFVLNPNIATQKLPNFQLKPETIRMFTYMNTNPSNKVYQTWLTKVAHVDTKKFGFDSSYKLGTNIVALTDPWNSDSEIIENTYTYITGNALYGQNKNINNAKIIGINNLDNPEKTSIILFDKENKIINDRLINVLKDNSYPLIINEVVAKLYNLKVGDKLSIKPNNDLFRYVDKANNVINQKYYPFTVVGITTSKSEQQMYTNQAFANEILGYNSDRLNAKQSYQNIVDSFGNKYVPFNGIFTNNPNSPMINNFASIYSVSGLTPINAFFKKDQDGNPIANEAFRGLGCYKNNINNIVKFKLVVGNESETSIINKLINIFGNGNDLNCLNASINMIDAKFATSLMGQTIDSTLENVQTILITALLPTLFIIICLMATMIVSESRRLIAIMKVLGIGDWKNTFNFLFIYFVVLFFGLIIALPLTYGILSLFSDLTFSFFNIIISPLAPWWIYLATIGCLGIIFASMFYVVKQKMGKINLPQAISFES